MISLQPSGNRGTQEDPDWLLSLKTGYSVQYVRIRCADDRTHFSDNYSSLLPGESQTVCVKDCPEQPLVEIIPIQAITDASGIDQN